ncbi:MAG TPA: Asp-tRNA(Asn)/Glu-tRNA(Gln) amidotransferase subunit GatA [Patescibacteria group bacterium]
MTLELIQQALASGQMTSVQVVSACFEVIEAKDTDINAFVRVYKDEALVAAAASDARRAEGSVLGPLDGVPVAIKDNISYQDHGTSAGSAMLKEYVAPYDATVVAKLKAGGAIIIGHVNMDEFAMGSTGESSAFGATKNPHDLSRVPGGSSSGAAAAVAARMVPVSYGSDTGGSIRQPAAFCGVVGLKPTYGAVSRYGLLAMASSLDQIGPIGATVADVEVAYEAIKGFDRADSTSSVPETLPAKTSYRIGVPKQFYSDGLDVRIRDTLDATLSKLEDEGHTIVRDLDIPLLDQSVAIYYLIVPAEVSSNLARYDGIRYGVHGEGVADSRTQGFGDEVKRRIMLGTFVLSAGYSDAYYKRAQTARAALTEQLSGVFQEVDVLLSPVTPELPFKLGEKTNDPLAMYLSDIYTLPVNLAGLPALSVPAAWVQEGNALLPIGLQIIGPQWSEPWLCDLGKKIEVPHA